MKRSVFDLSFEHKTTCRMGQLVPVMCEEVMPGDTFKVNTEAFCRILPLIAPMMHNVRLRMEYWFVPTRLLWNEFEDFIGGGRDGKAEPVFPTISSPTNGFAVGSLADHFGLPVAQKLENGSQQIISPLEVSALQFRAYAFLYNECYRNPTLQEEVPISFDSGPDTTTNTDLLMRCWERDYFTSALPFAQRGDPVYLPLGTTAPVRFNGPSGDIATVKSVNSPTGVGYFHVNSASGTYPVGIANSGSGFASNLDVDLTHASSVSIDEMRASVQMQLWKTLAARGGYRYIEMILSQFGVKSSDARLQRPEFLGGGSTYVSIAEVLQTSASNETSPQGHMAGHALSYNTVPKFKRFFEEFGYVICLLSVMPRTAYQQGVERQWSRRSKWDYPFPVFDHLGEQRVLNKELFATGTSRDDETFGFQGRYNEFRYKSSQVSGDFRSSLSYWHMGRIFGSPPALNAEMVQSNPTDRVYAVFEGDHCLLDVFHHFKAIRPLSKYAKPGRMDHYR